MLVIALDSEKKKKNETKWMLNKLCGNWRPNNNLSSGRNKRLIDGLRREASKRERSEEIFSDSSWCLGGFLPLMWKSAPFPPCRESDAHLGFTLPVKITVIFSNLAADAQAGSTKPGPETPFQPWYLTTYLDFFSFFYLSSSIVA